MEKEIHVFTTDYIKKLFTDINTNLLRRFNKFFKKEENGKPRDWPAIEEPKIRELFTKFKAEVSAIIEEFKYIKVKWDVVSSPTPGQNKNEGETQNGFDPMSLGRSILGRSNSLMYSRLLTEDQINRVKDRFNEETDQVLEEAIRKHVIFSSKLTQIA